MVREFRQYGTEGVGEKVRLLIRLNMHNLEKSDALLERDNKLDTGIVTPECFYRGSSSEPAWIPA